MERWKTSFFKEKVENEDLYKSVLNKIMTTHEEGIKCNFIAPLGNAGDRAILFKI